MRRGAAKRGTLGALLLALPLALAACPEPQAGGGGGAGEGPHTPPGPIGAVVKAGDHADILVADYDLSQLKAPIEPFKASLGAPANVFNLGGPGAKSSWKAVVDQLLATHPKLVFAIGGDALDLARDRAKDLPIVFAGVVNWQKHAGVQGAANIAGVALEVPPETQFTQFKIVDPQIKRIGVIHGDGSAQLVIAAKGAAQDTQVQVIDAPVKNPEDVPAAWRAIKTSVDALWMVPDRVVFDAERFQYLNSATQDAKVPYLGFSTNFVKAGCFFSLSADYGAAGSQAGIAASRIMAGEATPKEIGVVAPVGTESALNVQTAKALGLTIDDAVLKNVDQVIGGPESQAEKDEKSDKPDAPK